MTLQNQCLHFLHGRSKLNEQSIVDGLKDISEKTKGFFMKNQFSRTELLLGTEAMQTLSASRVAVFGIGGVGGYTVEALVRSGIGAIDLIDNDQICPSNINRQIYATQKTLGQYKTDVAARRIAEINPDVIVRTYRTFYMPDTADQFDFTQYDYIVDAIDTVTGKLTLVENAALAGVPIISSMGTGNKLDPTAFEVTDIYKTSVCPLAKVMRRELKRRGIQKLKVVCSREMPRPLQNIQQDSYDPNDPEGTASMEENSSRKRQIPGSIAFVPPTAGLIIAGEVIKDLIKTTGRSR